MIILVYNKVENTTLIIKDKIVSSQKISDKMFPFT